MGGSKINKSKNNIKEKAFTEFSKGKLTQREVALKYDICETELSRFFTKKYRSAGYPQITSYEVINKT